MRQTDNRDRQTDETDKQKRQADRRNRQAEETDRQKRQAYFNTLRLKKCIYSPDTVLHAVGMEQQSREK